MPKHEALEAKLYLRREAESYPIVLENSQKQSKICEERDQR